MTREVSRRTSGPPEWKGAIRPDITGLKRLDPTIVKDEPDVIVRRDHKAMDRYLATLDGSTGPVKQINDGTKPMPRFLKERKPNG